jgi:hypothetical protein
MRIAGVKIPMLLLDIGLLLPSHQWTTEEWTPLILDDFWLLGGTMPPFSGQSDLSIKEDLRITERDGA